jgi:predicted small secreted protein
MELIIGIGVGVAAGMYIASQIEKSIRSNITNKKLMKNLDCQCKKRDKNFLRNDIDGKRKKKKTN